MMKVDKLNVEISSVMSRNDRMKEKHKTLTLPDYLN
jgi:hypothetical protein